MNLYARRETKTLEFKKALKVIYNSLKDTDVNWVIVGGFGLAIRGLPIEPHDVHIMTVNTTLFRHRPREESPARNDGITHCRTAPSKGN